MKAAKVFLILQYICLAGMTAVPLLISSVISQEVKSSVPSLAKVLLLTLIAVLLIAALIIEISASRSAARQIKKGNKETALRIWRQLKLISIPFYAACFLIYIISAPLCFPLSLITVPLSFLFCWVMIIISGISGIKIIKSLKAGNVKISPVHFALQVLPVADVISTVILKKKTAA